MKKMTLNSDIFNLKKRKYVDLKILAILYMTENLSNLYNGIQVLNNGMDKSVGCSFSFSFLHVCI